MDLRSLRYFCAAAEAGSLTAAAERCHVAQPSISNAVAQLEQEFALRLFSRSKKGVTLTPEGEAFYQEAARLLGNAGEMEQLFKRVQRQRLPAATDRRQTTGLSPACTHPAHANGGPVAAE